MVLTPKKKLIRFYGRRKGRKLSAANSLALELGKNFILKKSDFSEKSESLSEKLLGIKLEKIVLEIGFGNGENLLNSAKKNPKTFFLGADPFLNTNAKCIREILNNKLMNVKIWPDDIRQIINLIPSNSISEVKLLFPDPWPKLKHKNRRIVQNEFINILYRILIPKGKVTLGTDHSIMKSWILEIFQNNLGFIWKAEVANDWRIRPINCFQTKYEKKSLIEKRSPNWFVFEKKNVVT